MPNEANKQPHRLPFSYHKTPQSHFIVKMLSNFSLHTWGVANESAAHETCLLNISGAYNMQHYWPMDTCQSMDVSLSLKLSLSLTQNSCVFGMKQFHRKFLGFRIGPPFRSSPRVHKTCLTSDETATNKKIRVTEVHASKSLQFWTSERAALKLRTLLSHCIWIVWFLWVVLYPACYELGRAYFCLSCWPIFVGWEAWSGFGFTFHFNLLGGVTCNML